MATLAELVDTLQQRVERLQRRVAVTEEKAHAFCWMWCGVGLLWGAALASLHVRDAVVGVLGVIAMLIGMWLYPEP